MDLIASLVTILNFDYYNDTLWLSYENRPANRCGAIARLSKKSKKSDFVNFAYNKINSLKKPTSQIYGFSTVSAAI